ncbi:MAG: cache and HAMP domain-containing protein [Euryarchaeota archaeon]|nr:cache and HAMP domain-containing protein [Euryarchaeota archaeon]
MKIYHKLLATLLLVVLVPLGIVGLYGVTTSTETLSTLAVDHVRERAGQHAEVVRGSLQAAPDDVYFLSHVQPLIEYADLMAQGKVREAASEHTDLEVEFLTFSQARRVYSRIRYIDGAGDEVVRVDSDGQTSRIVEVRELQNRRSAPYFTEGVKLVPGQVYISGVALDRETEQRDGRYRPIVRYAAPLPSLDTKRGVVVVDTFAEESMKGLKGGEEMGLTFLVDSRGYYIYHPVEGKRWGAPEDLNTGEGLQRDYPALASRVLSGEKGVIADGDAIVAYEPVYVQKGGKFLVVVEVLPKDEVLRPVTAFRSIFALVVLGALLVALLVGTVISRAIVNPLLRLTRAADEISSGELEALERSIEVGSEDEIKDLAESFKRMAKSLKIATSRARVERSLK